MSNTEHLNRLFLDEYNSGSAILKYSPKTAGHGIGHLIRHDYADVYDGAIQVCRQTSTAPLRVLEFGCGAGMNLIALLTRLDQHGVPVEEAYGTDFSVSLIRSARRDAFASLPARIRDHVRFEVARNERLGEELSATTRQPIDRLEGSFDFIFGVNTFRYCHRLGNAQQCADGICRLLRPGGVSVMIDMNDRFPAFRSHLWPTDESPEEVYLPSLDEYAGPFEQAGLEITTRDHFCWVPHSAGRTLTYVCRALTPVLNAAVRSRAMRSLVVAKKPS